MVLEHALKIAIMHVGRLGVPVHHPPGSVEQRAELDPHDPTPVALALFADLVLGSPFSARVEQLNAQTVAEVDEARLGQETLRPALVAPQEPKQARTLGQVGEQWAKVAPQPVIEAPLRLPTQNEQNAQGDQFAGPEFGTQVFGHISHGLVYAAE
jgi:hypothetical protein